LQSYDPELKVNPRAHAIAREAGWMVTPQDAGGNAQWPVKRGLASLTTAIDRYSLKRAAAIVGQYG
jgi:hypothetical protein